MYNKKGKSMNDWNKSRGFSTLIIQLQHRKIWYEKRWKIFKFEQKDFFIFVVKIFFFDRQSEGIFCCCERYLTVMKNLEWFSLGNLFDFPCWVLFCYGFNWSVSGWLICFRENWYFMLDAFFHCWRQMRETQF